MNLVEINVQDTGVCKLETKYFIYFVFSLRRKLCTACPMGYGDVEIPRNTSWVCYV